ncbi:S1C family serine protease [Chloroflexota bacterium]
MSKENKPLTNFSDALADAVDQAADSIVLVDGRNRFPASGILYAEDLVLTADHVLERDEGVRVVLADGKEIAADVTGRDPSSDLALLKLSESVEGSAEPFKGEMRVGELVLALGRHSTKGIEASLGVVSYINGPVRTHRGGMIERFIRTDAAPLPGFSGGALINARGQIVGINTSGLSHGTLLTLPTVVAWQTAQTLAEFGSIKRGYLGIRSQTVNIPETAFDVLGREQTSGLLVVHTEENSPADESDLEVGDIITGIADVPVTDHDELAGTLTGEIVGQPAAVEILRVGELLNVEVTIGERKMRRPGNHGRRTDRRGDHRHGQRGSRHHGHHHP